MSTEKEVKTAEPDFEAIAKMLHPDSGIERAVFDGPHRLNHDSPAFVNDQWRIETARINVAKALKYFWDNYADPENAELKKENERLRTALKKIFKYMDDGMLIRDISKDDQPGWAIKILPFVTDIKAAYELLNPKQDATES